MAAIGTLPNGDVVVVGGAVGPVQVANEMLTGASDTDVLVAAIEVDGRVRWARLFGGLGYDVAEGLAIAADGTIYITGQFFDRADLGDGNVAQGNGGNEAFVASFTSAGAFRWAIHFGGNDLSTAYDTDMGTSVAIAPDGDLVIGGSVSRVVDFGDGMQTPASGAQNDGFVARYSPDGKTLRWVRRWGVTGENVVAGVALDASGQIYVSGSYAGSPDFGSGAVPARGGNVDAFMLGLTSNAGHRWDKTWGGPDTQRLYGLTVLGNLVMSAGYYWNVIDLPVAASFGRSDGIIVAYTTAGVFDHALRFGGANCEFARNITGSTAEVVVSGAFSDTVDFGDGPHASRGGTDAFMVGLDQTGVVWSDTFGSVSDDKSTGMTGSRSSGLYVVGHRNLAFDANCNEHAHSAYITRF